MILYPWLRVAVPLFFIISSYFIFSKIRNSSQSEQKALLKKFVVRNLQLYLCWLVILLPITLYIRKETYFSNSLLENILTILKSFLFGSTFVASWYIMASIIGVLIIYWLNVLLKKDILVFIVSFLTFCIVSLASSYTSAITGTFIYTAIEQYTDIFGGLVLSFPAALFWVFMGKLFAEQKIRIKSVGLWAFLTICSCIALYAEWMFVISLDGSYNNDSYFMLAPLCVLLFVGIGKIKPFYWKYSVYCKRISTVIYVVHGSMVPVVSKLISVILHVDIPLLSFIITLAGCATIYFIIEIAIQKYNKRPIGKVLKMLY